MERLQNLAMLAVAVAVLFITIGAGTQVVQLANAANATTASTATQVASAR
jgi:hypothetical protein